RAARTTDPMCNSPRYLIVNTITRGGAPMAQPRTIIRHDHLSSYRRNQAITPRRLSVAAAACVLVGGYVHFCLYEHGYRFIPKIGPRRARQTLVAIVAQSLATLLLGVAMLQARATTYRETLTAVAPSHTRQDARKAA